MRIAIVLCLMFAAHTPAGGALAPQELPAEGEYAVFAQASFTRR